MSNKNVDLALQKVVDAWKSGNIAERVTLASFPTMDMPSHNWTMGNRWMSFITTGYADCRGYKQWLAVGRYVKQGEKAGYILRPIIVKDKETEEEKFCGFSTIPIFGVGQTEGAELPKPPSLPELPLLNVAKAWGIEVVSEWGNSSFYGCFSQERKQITMATPEAKVFLHELMHAAHAKVKGKLKGGQVASQEIVAEFGAEVLRSMLGLEKDTSGVSYDYVESYARKIGKTVAEACRSVLSETAKAIELILKEGGMIVDGVVVPYKQAELTAE